MDNVPGDSLCAVACSLGSQFQINAVTGQGPDVRGLAFSFGFKFALLFVVDSLAIKVLTVRCLAFYLDCSERPVL